MSRWQILVFKKSLRVRTISGTSVGVREDLATATLASMTVARRPAVTTAHLVFLAIYLTAASSFLLPSAFCRGNLQPFSRSSMRSSRPPRRPPCPLPTPAEHTAIGSMPIRMLSDDNGGEKQQEGEELGRKERRERTAVTTAAAVLPQTLGNGRYIVRSVLGTGSTASTYRCTTLPLPPPQQVQQDQGRPEEEGFKERLRLVSGKAVSGGLCVDLPSTTPLGAGAQSSVSWQTLVPCLLVGRPPQAHTWSQTYQVQKRATDCR